MEIRINSVLKPDQLYKLLNVAINETYNYKFKPFSWVKPYIFIEKDINELTFYLYPKGWDRLHPIKGKIKERCDGSLIILSIFPGIWFYILFTFIPLILIYQSIKEYSLIVCFFWLIIMSIVFSYQILAFLNIAKKVKEIIGSKIN